MTAHYPRPAVLDRIPRDRPAVIEASAGTGKTYTIEHMVIDLLLNAGATIDQVLVLTYTERAAGELRKRVRSIISTILGATCDGGPGCRCDRSGSFWTVDAAARGQLARALLALDTAAIGTIHGFFARVLTEQAFTSGRLFDGTLEDGRTLFGRAFKTALRRTLARGTGGPAELLALWLNEGGGNVDDLEKLLYRCYSSRRLVRPECDLDALRNEVETNPLFEIDLDGEMERITATLRALKVHGNTVKAICGNHLPAVLGALRDAGRCLDVVGNRDIIKSIHYLDDKMSGLRLAGIAATVAKAVEGLRRRLAPLEAAVIHACLPVIFREFDRLTTATGAFDYDDILAGVDAAVRGPCGPALVRSLRDRFRFALIDESQDTDDLQWAVFRRVFAESESRNLVYFIGDPKQAIYGFRGADVTAYLAAKAHIATFGLNPVALPDNYRSTAALIDAYNRILDPAAAPPFLHGKIVYNVPVRPGRELVALEPDGTPAVPVHVLEIEPRGESLDKNELYRGLARQVAREAAYLLSGSRGLRFGPPGKETPIKAGDIFVLTGTNNEARRIGAALREAGVPFAFYKQDGLFDTPEAAVVRDLLAAVDNPADPSRRGRAWITPFFSVPLGVLPDLFELPDTHPLLRRLLDWKDLADARRFEALFSRILDESGIVRREILFQDGERALTNYLHLFEILLEEAHTTGCGLTELVTTLDAYIHDTRKPPAEDGDVQRLESDRDAVQIMTIHKSKGLEAAVVFLYGGFTARQSDGLYEYHDVERRRVLDVEPDDTGKAAAKQELDEERQRLYYVALTRAKARLYLPFVPLEHWSNRWDGGYRRVNDRLAKVLAQPEASGLFHRVRFRDTPIRPFGGGADSHDRVPASWQPRRQELHERDERAGFAGLRVRHRACEVTSYSRMKRGWAIDPVPIEPDEFRREPGGDGDPATLAEGELPGGRATGTFLHEIIETVPLDETARSESLDAWRCRDAVASVIDNTLTRHAIDPAFRADAEAMVYHALKADVPLGDGRSIPGLCRGTQSLREMEFLFPFPEDAHPRLSDPVPGKLVVERGFIKGFVDLVVEHEGLVYFADWKSDVLPSYDAGAVAAHVAEAYDLQAQLYSLALVKALGIRSEDDYNRRFGGMVYVFLRGLTRPGPAGQGLHFARPTWADVLRYEQELIGHGERTRTAGGPR
jgi:exodeoxyribonuclease V beta subunit